MLALGLAAPPAAAHQTATSAAYPPAPASESDDQARLEAIYSAANDAIQAGNFAAAAERYADVLATLAESRATHESRALALLDSVAARRQAHARTGERDQLCHARELTVDYLAAADAAHGPAAAELDGVLQARQLRDELDRQLASMPEGTCPGDQVATPPPATPPLRLAPAPAPARDLRVVAGVVLLATGGLGLALMTGGLGLGASAESRLRDIRGVDPARDIDELLADGQIARGRAGNRLAIVGGVLAGVTLVAGATLLALGKTRPRSARLALLPGGVGLRF